jgi:DHA1 family inner membrane transport protein
VPAGSWIGLHAGWRATFWAVSGLGVVALAAVLLLMPRSMKLAKARSGAGSGWRIVLRPGLLRALALTAFGFGGIFTTLTYLSPLLRSGAGFSASQVNALLLLFGLGLTLGNVLGGWAADRWPRGSMFAILGALALIELALPLTLEMPVLVLPAIFLWGMAAFATAPGLQSRVLEEASDAPALGSTLNIAAFNLGNAGAAWIGAQALDAGLSLAALPLLSAGLAAVAIGLLLIRRRAR